MWDLTLDRGSAIKGTDRSTNNTDLWRVDQKKRFTRLYGFVIGYL